MRRTQRDGSVQYVQSTIFAGSDAEAGLECPAEVLGIAKSPVMGDFRDRTGGKRRIDHVVSATPKPALPDRPPNGMRLSLEQLVNRPAGTAEFVRDLANAQVGFGQPAVNEFEDRTPAFFPKVRKAVLAVRTKGHFDHLSQLPAKLFAVPL